jgi:hypothetical protein
MNETELQLSRLFNAVIGEPPTQVNVHAVRRKATRRRAVSGLAGAATLLAVGSVGVAVAATVSTSAITPAPNHTTNPQSSQPPRYYFVSSYESIRSGVLTDTIRATATGQVTATTGCPGTRTLISGAAAAAPTPAGQTFFISCLGRTPNYPSTYTGTKIYRFTVNKSGRVAGFKLVPGGNLAGLRSSDLAASPNGSELAIDVASVKAGPISEILVINPKTGQRAIWHSSRLNGGLAFNSYDLSFADNGRELASLGFTKCLVKGCESPGEEMVAVSPVWTGGSLASGRKIFTEGQLVKPSAGWVNDAYLNPDGATAIATTISRLGNLVLRVSAATGQSEGFIYHSEGGTLRLYGLDPTGQFPLVSAGPIGAEKNGWVDHDKLIPLRPAGRLVWIEAW